MVFSGKAKRFFVKKNPVSYLILSFLMVSGFLENSSLYAAPPTKKKTHVSSNKKKSSSSSKSSSKSSVRSSSKSSSRPSSKSSSKSSSKVVKKTGNSKSSGSSKKTVRKTVNSKTSKKRPVKRKTTSSNSKGRSKSPARKKVVNSKKKTANAKKKTHHIHTSHPKSHYKDSRERAGVSKQKRRGHLIVLDAGHGGYDFGASAFHCQEKQLALKTAFLAKKHLTEKGYKVIMTRTRDVFIPLNKRAAIANKTHGKLFLSFHYNAAKTEKAKGIEVFYYQSGQKWRANSSKKLATCVLSKLLTRTGSPSRGVKKGNFHVIRETNMPAILIEGGFVTHKAESTNLKDHNYLDRIALAIAEGVENYFRS